MKKFLEVLKKIFKNTVFLIEFLVSIILIKSIFDFAVVKIYDGYYSFSKLILIIISMVAFIGITVYVLKNYSKSIEKIFLFIAIPLGIGYGILLMPQNVPDEGSHMMRAYDISMGHFITKVDRHGNSSSTIIEDIRNFSYMRFPNYDTLREEIKEKTNYDKTGEIICAAQGYSPLLYVGTSVAFILGRLIGLNIFMAVYLGRMFNLIIYLTLGYFAIKKLPFGKLALLVFLCMPMMLQQAASASADAILNSTLVYYIAHLIYITFKEDEITRKDRIFLYVLTALVGMFKYIYILIAGILFIKPFKDKENRKIHLKTIFTMILIGGLFCVGWFVISSKAKSISPVFEEYNKIAHVDSTEQLTFIKGHIGEFAKVIINEYYTYGFDYIFEAIGSKLGWLNVNISPVIIVTYLIVLIYSCISEDSKYCFNNLEKLWINILVLVISLILFVLMYITFTPVGLEKVAGVQGRYFSAILILPLLCLISKNNYLKIERKNEKIITISFILNLLTLVAVFMFYV